MTEPQIRIDPGTPMTDEQLAELQGELDDALRRGYHLRPMPPRWPTPGELRDFLRENVTIVRPGETLVIRIGADWGLTPSQMRELNDSLNWHYDDGTPLLPFRSVVVPGSELGVVQAEPGQ